MSFITICHWLASLIVLAEALNKLERIDLFDGQHGVLPRLGGLSWTLTPWRWKRVRVLMVLETFAWAGLAIGAGGGVVGPLLQLDRASPQDLAVIGGFALFIIRSRLEEGKSCTVS